MLWSTKYHSVYCLERCRWSASAWPRSVYHWVHFFSCSVIFIWTIYDLYIRLWVFFFFSLRKMVLIIYLEFRDGYINLPRSKSKWLLLLIIDCQLVGRSILQSNIMGQTLGLLFTKCGWGLIYLFLTLPADPTVQMRQVKVQETFLFSWVSHYSFWSAFKRLYLQALVLFEGTFDGAGQSNQTKWVSNVTI